jgi:hypothetical protein
METIVSRYANFLARISKAEETQQQNQQEVDLAVKVLAGRLNSRWTPGSALFAVPGTDGVLTANHPVDLDKSKKASYALIVSFPNAERTIVLDVSFELTKDGVKIIVEGAGHQRLIGFQSAFNMDGAIEEIEDAVEKKLEDFERSVQLR